ncbi:MAG: DUF116 domain-containing protein [Elusimicrobiota bacterium]|jgi:hypothetical protein|nr:DUF116 domain-containing protein [Elusimicrobiota bacterium]
MKLLRFFFIEFFYISSIIIGSISSQLKLKIRKIFIEINNFYTLKKYKKMKNKLDTGKDKILILLPHCLQSSLCPYKITFDVNNCKMCGKCIISSFIKISKDKNLYIKVANGGTLARKAIKDVNPDITLAVACERDLVSGIYDAYPHFIYGILNSRPNGDCMDTSVDIKEIEKFIYQLKIIE